MGRRWRKANNSEGSSGRHRYPRLGGEVALDKEGEITNKDAPLEKSTEYYRNPSIPAKVIRMFLGPTVEIRLVAEKR